MTLKIALKTNSVTREHHVNFDMWKFAQNFQIAVLKLPKEFLYFFKNCSYYYPTQPAPKTSLYHYPHPHHPYLPNIPGPFIPASPVTTSRMERLENLVQRFATYLAAMGTELATVKNLTTKNAGDNSEFQSIENGTTGNVRMDDEAPAVENILTISDDSPDNPDNPTGDNLEASPAASTGTMLESPERSTPVLCPTPVPATTTASKSVSGGKEKLKLSENLPLWAKQTDDHLEKLEKDFDIIEDWTIQEISALEMRLEPKITNIEKKITNLEGNYNNQ